jgi:hypothetical protein
MPTHVSGSTTASVITTKAVHASTSASAAQEPTEASGEGVTVTRRPASITKAPVKTPPPKKEVNLQNCKNDQSFLEAHKEPCMKILCATPEYKHEPLKRNRCKNATGGKKSGKGKGKSG